MVTLLAYPSAAFFLYGEIHANLNPWIHKLRHRGGQPGLSQCSILKCNLFPSLGLSGKRTAETTLSGLR